MTKKQTIEKEVHQNYLAFKTMKFHGLDEGKFALMKDAKVVEILVDKMDAHKMGKRLFADGVYSIQEIKRRNEDLGFMSYALVRPNAEAV